MFFVIASAAGAWQSRVFAAQLAVALGLGRSGCFGDNERRAVGLVRKRPCLVFHGLPRRFAPRHDGEAGGCAQ
jgi:hypothetical protein